MRGPASPKSRAHRPAAASPPVAAALALGLADRGHRTLLIEVAAESRSHVAVVVACTTAIKLWTVGTPAYIVMQACTGGELFDRIASRSGGLSERDAAMAVVDVVREERHGPRQRPERFEQ